MSSTSTEPRSEAHWKRNALLNLDASDASDGDVNTRKQIKYGTTCEAMSAMFSEYCENSTIHGVKYLGERKRSRIEKLFWLLILALSTYACATQIMNIWQKWNEEPIIVSLTHTTTPVWQIPFPTVTICSETKARPSVLNFTDAYWKTIDQSDDEDIPTNNVEDKELSHFLAAAQVCDSHLSESLSHNESITDGPRFINLLTEMMPFFNDSFWICKWLNTVSFCENLFQRYVTDDGICYSFNSLSPIEVYREEGWLSEFLLQTENRTNTDWNLEDGYQPTANPETYPLRALGSGTKNVFRVLLNGIKKDFDNLCKGALQGFKVMLNTPGEIPQSSKHYYRIPFDQDITIAIKPKMITTSAGLRSYTPVRRQCYFQNERYLRYFHMYTQSNCELECLANFTLAKCGCVKFSMPRDMNVPVCGISRMKCYIKAEDDILLEAFNDAQLDGNSRVGGVCNCLPACTSISYDAEISQVNFDFKSFVNDYGENLVDSKVTRLSIFFKDAQFNTYSRSQVYGTVEFLANCGGLLCLFLGLSLLSIVELIYFCTLRLIMNLRMRYKRSASNARNYTNPTTLL